MKPQGDAIECSRCWAMLPRANVMNSGWLLGRGGTWLCWLCRLRLIRRTDNESTMHETNN